MTLVKLREFKKGMDIEKYLETELRQNWSALNSILKGTKIGKQCVSAVGDGLTSPIPTSLDVVSASITTVGTRGCQILVNFRFLTTPTSESVVITLLRDGVEVDSTILFADGVAGVSRWHGTFSVLDKDLSPGTYTYKVNLSTATGTGGSFIEPKITVYEV